MAHTDKRRARSVDNFRYQLCQHQCPLHQYARELQRENTVADSSAYLLLQETDWLTVRALDAQASEAGPGLEAEFLRHRRIDLLFKLGGARHRMPDNYVSTLNIGTNVVATNIQEQLVREVREGILNPDAVDFGGKGLFVLPYYRTSWPLYREFLNSAFVDDFEKRYGLDPSIEVKW